MAGKNTGLLIEQIRILMNDVKLLGTDRPISAYIIDTRDAHFSEYIAPCDERRAFITGFDGSAGTAIITQKEALLWTDGRYYLQASQQLDKNWILMKDGLTETLKRQDWLGKFMLANSLIGIDPTLVSVSEWMSLSKSLKADGKILTAVKKNLVDLVWEKIEHPKPQRPTEPAFHLSTKFSGKSTSEKLIEIQKEMKENNADILVLTELDEIAYFLNLRSKNNIPFNPVFFSYVLIFPDNVEVFIDDKNLDQENKNILIQQCNNISFYGYEEIFEKLYNHARNVEKKVWISKNCNYELSRVIPEENQLIKLSPISLMKAVKNPTEVEGMRSAHIRDAAALISFFGWLEDRLLKGDTITEISAKDKLSNFRSKQENFAGESFETISSAGPNAAIIHYSPSPKTNRKINLNEMYLVDSGGQYYDGTTDVTRTVYFGNNEPSDYEKECYTRVLKGYISLSRLIFPSKILGNHLDSFARSFLWDVGLDYNHGTGHGIGHFLNVHEGPSGIHFRVNNNDPGIVENMFFSNEPGYYEDGKFGIRIESIIRAKKAETKYHFGNKTFLSFEDITLVPFYKKLIKIELLTKDELNFINDYHQKCRKIVGAYMKKSFNDELGLNWLHKETEPIII